jgi:hypothetical protein
VTMLRTVAARWLATSIVAAQAGQPASSRTRTRALADTPRRSAAIPNARTKVEPEVDGPASRGDPADEHSAREEPALALGDEAIGRLELAPLDRPRRGPGHGVGPVGAVRHRGRLAGADREPPGVVATAEPPERRRIVAARHAPVDRTIGGHPGSRAGVTDQAVVADRDPTSVHRRVGRGRHRQLLPRNSPSTAP